MVLTLGTGIGTAIFVDGRLLPNTELGHLEVRGEEAEHRASARVRTDRDLGWAEWAAAVNEVLAAYHALLWPDLFIIGGGVTENWENSGRCSRAAPEIVPAHFRNDGGHHRRGDGGGATPRGDAHATARADRRPAVPRLPTTLDCCFRWSCRDTPSSRSCRASAPRSSP